MDIPFAKYSGCGNDFIVIDNRRLHLCLPAKGIVSLCHRRQGIGADGIILLEDPLATNAPYRMRIFNADGSEAEMCGNGVRCLADYIRTIENTTGCFEIETMQGIMKISFPASLPFQQLVHIGMPAPSEITSKTIIIGDQEILLYYLDTGVPHAVLFTQDIDNESLFEIAPLIRSHREFHPKGTNVDFVKILSETSLAIRTYERGVEGETYACGTGAAACAIAAAFAYSVKTPTHVWTKSGDCLCIDFQRDGLQTTDLAMSGPAVKVFEGLLHEGFDRFSLEIKSSHSVNSC